MKVLSTNITMNASNPNLSCIASDGDERRFDSTLSDDSYGPTAHSRSNHMASSTQHEKEQNLKVQELQVACAELSSLPSGRTVYQKRGAIYFLTDSNTLKEKKQEELSRLSSTASK
ncbi:unnamed protein product [Closterium sp. Yama58-4]|nr:unnamed protein product [Closterium sp. Yama58-4]